MDYEKSLKETIKEELKKMSSMSWRQRIGYVWDYYKFLMVAAVILIMVVSIVVTVFRNLQINHILNVYMINCSAYDAEPDMIRSEFEEYIGGIGKNDQIVLDTTVSIDPENATEYSMAGQMKITALLAAGSVDLMFLDEKAYAFFQGAGTFQELSAVIGEEKLSAWEDHLVGGAQGWYAIDIQDSPVLGRYDLYGGAKVYAVLIPGTEHLELCEDFIDYLLGLQAG